MKIAALAVSAAALLLADAAVAQDSPVRLTFQLGAAEGVVMVAVFDSEAAWNGAGAPAAVARVAAGPGPVETEFNLPAGDYAMRAFHDVDEDGELDTNPFGIPIEPFAFSNNARGRMGPASWSAARFTVSGPTAQTIDLR